MTVESFMHKSAKQLMVKWLRAAAANSGSDDYASFDFISWRINRGAPDYGIWMEYPFMADGVGQYPVWDEWEDGNRPWGNKNAVPTFDELVQANMSPTCIVDIAIQHKGGILYAIEIVHKHPCSEEKLKFLQDMNVQYVLEIPARWIMGQVKIPNTIPSEFLVSS